MENKKGEQGERGRERMKESKKARKTFIMDNNLRREAVPLARSDVHSFIHSFILKKLALLLCDGKDSLDNIQPLGSLY